MYITSEEVQELKESLKDIHSKLIEVTPTNESVPTPATIQRSITGSKKPYYRVLEARRRIIKYKKHLQLEMDRVRRVVMAKLRKKLPSSGTTLQEHAKYFVSIYGPDDSSDWGVSRKKDLPKLHQIDSEDELLKVIFLDDVPSPGAESSFVEMELVIEELEQEAADILALIKSMSDDNPTLTGLLKLERQYSSVQDE